jgi:hypothetical protein
MDSTNAQLDQWKADGRRALKPLCCELGWKQEKNFKKWFYKTLSELEEIHEVRIVTQQNYLIWYLGQYDYNMEYRLIRPARYSNLRRLDYGVPTMVNRLYFLTEQSVSKESLQKPTFEVLPSNAEESGDRLSSRSMKPLLDAAGRKNDAELLFQENSRRTKVFGENFIYVGWDKDLNTFDDSGNKIIGDVKISPIEPYFVLYPTKREWKEVDYVIVLWDIINKDEAEKKYKTKIETDKSNQVFSFETGETKGYDELVVYKFFHRPTVDIPDGVVATIIGDQVVEFNIEKYPYDHKELPFVRRTDIDVPGSCWAESVYRWAVPVQHQLNKHYWLNGRNVMLGGHPKWMMHKGAADIKSLGNAATIVQVKPGMQYPQLVTFNSVTQDSMMLLERYERQLDMIFGIHGVSLGQPPPGARSKNMLDFYAEEERQRNSTQLIKHNECIRQVFQQVASVIGSYYPLTPERMIRIIGSDSMWDLRKVKDFRFSSEYEIIVQNSNGFSDSIQGRIEEIDKLLQMFPGAISPQQAFNILQYKIPEKLYDIATAALKMAQTENEQFADGSIISPPEEGEDYIVHLEQHYLMIQTPTYKEASDVRKEEFNTHIGMTEMMLTEAMAKNPALAQIVMQKFMYFPLFYVEEPPPLLMPTEEGAPMEGSPLEESPPLLNGAQ